MNIIQSILSEFGPCATTEVLDYLSKDSDITEGVGDIIPYVIRNPKCSTKTLGYLYRKFIMQTKTSFFI